LLYLFTITRDLCKKALECVFVFVCLYTSKANLSGIYLDLLRPNFHRNP